MVPDFENILNKIQCPVLAIFGEKDYVVDWKKTKPLYESTIGNNTSLTIKSFGNGNPLIVECQTGMYNEKLEKLEYCSGYIEALGRWLEKH